VYPAHTDTSAETAPPFGDSSIHDRWVKVFPLVDQTRFQFIHVSSSGRVNFLLQYTTDWVKVRWIRIIKRMYMYIWYKTLDILLSTYQKLLKLLDIWRSSDTNSLCSFLDTVYCPLPIHMVPPTNSAWTQLDLYLVFYPVSQTNPHPTPYHDSGTNFLLLVNKLEPCPSLSRSALDYRYCDYWSMINHAPLTYNRLRVV